MVSREELELKINNLYADLERMKARPRPSPKPPQPEPKPPQPEPKPPQPPASPEKRESIKKIATLTAALLSGFLADYFLWNPGGIVGKNEIEIKEEKMYQEALELFYNTRYTQALEKLDESEGLREGIQFDSLKKQITTLKEIAVEYKSWVTNQMKKKRFSQAKLNYDIVIADLSGLSADNNPIMRQGAENLKDYLKKNFEGLRQTYEGISYHDYYVISNNHMSINEFVKSLKAEYPKKCRDIIVKDIIYANDLKLSDKIKSGTVYRVPMKK